ncbi:MAG: N-formylglutamate amidohydrolase [Propionibacteriaceae bacterium]|nr:N-formylglutamate amidohydrolase [Propionibacteriaceae bacterium]
MKLSAKTILLLAPMVDSRTGVNLAGVELRPSDSPVILHIPHAGLAWPDDGTQFPDYRRLAYEMRLMADLHVDHIARIVDRLLCERGAAPANRFANRLSRVAMDPERFDDDTEEMNQVGMGVVYERTHTGRPLYTAGLSPADITRRKQLWHQPYSQALSDLVDQTLSQYGRCLIIDLHSYSVKPLACELHKSQSRPEVCLGYDPFHDPAIDHAEHVFRSHGYTVARNQPYQGSYVPLKHWKSTPEVVSLMVEIRKDQYLSDGLVSPVGVLRIATAIADHIESWQNMLEGLALWDIS